MAWNPNMSYGTVNSLAVSGTTVYAGGEFTSIGGRWRNEIAALDATTGNATAWDPNANGYVNSLLVSGTTVYATGNFTSIGGQSRNRIVALDSATGNVLAWNPNANGIVYSLAVNGAMVYVGGGFSSTGGQSRNGIAVLDSATGTAMAWNPNAIGGVSQVNSIAVNGTTVYVGGNFTSMGQGVGHPYFAQFGNFDSVPVIQPISRPHVATNTDFQITNLSGSNACSGAIVKLAYSLPKATHVSLRLYDISGQMQSELVNDYQNAGGYTHNMQRGKLATGAYLVVFKAGAVHQEKMVFLIK